MKSKAQNKPFKTKISPFNVLGYFRTAFAATERKIKTIKQFV